jgi:hypothetical protein
MLAVAKYFIKYVISAETKLSTYARRKERAELHLFQLEVTFKWLRTESLNKGEQFGQLLYNFTTLYQLQCLYSVEWDMMRENTWFLIQVMNIIFIKTSIIWNIFRYNGCLMDSQV